MGEIYKITNSINNKVYIGQTITTLKHRFSQHKCSALNKERKNALYNAIRKYGIENFFIENIETLPNNLLNQREQYWIKFYNSYKNGYNSTIGGDNGVPKFSDEQILSAWNKNLTLQETCGLLGCERHTLTKRLESLVPNYTLELKKRNLLKNRRDETGDRIRELWNNGLSSKQIQDQISIDRHLIKKYLLEEKSFSEEEWIKRNIQQRINSNPQKIGVIGINIKDNSKYQFNSLSDAARFVGNVSKASNIRACIIGKQKTAYGYKWFYLKDLGERC